MTIHWIQYPCPECDGSLHQPDRLYGTDVWECSECRLIWHIEELVEQEEVS